MIVSGCAKVTPKLSWKHVSAPHLVSMVRRNTFSILILFANTGYSDILVGKKTQLTLHLYFLKAYIKCNICIPRSLNCVSTHLLIVDVTMDLSGSSKLFILDLDWFIC